MATSASIGHGTIFAIGNGASPEVFETVAEVTSITPPGVTVDLIDATHMESPGRHREFIAGLKDGTEAQIEMNFIPGGPGQDAIVELLGTGETANMKITYTNGVVQSFAAFCTAFEPSVPVDDKMTASATFKVSGEVTWTP